MFSLVGAPDDGGVRWLKVPPLVSAVLIVMLHALDFCPPSEPTSSFHSAPKSSPALPAHDPDGS
jgi:hypothetical protein